MNKAEKKFRRCAVLVIFALLTTLLAVINGVNFTMASEDADRITESIARQYGSIEPNDSNVRNENNRGSGARSQTPPGGSDRPFKMGPMGPSSPEINASLRYFTFAFPKDGTEPETVVFHLSAVTEDEAKEWASELIKEKTGWTRGTYRYRVYKDHGVTYVTVIDQGRELLSCYRILAISAIGEILCLIVAWFVLLAIARKLYAPLQEADRKQRNFIQNANRAFRLPLTIIRGNTEIAERRYGPDDQTRSTRRQLNKLNALVDELGSIGLTDSESVSLTEIPLSEFLTAAVDRKAEQFAARGLALSVDIAPDVMLPADPEGMNRLTEELVGNALKFALTRASFTLKREGERIVLETQNDAALPDGTADQAFDRFTKLENALNGDSAGLGLSTVKEIVKAHNGRAWAAVENGVFTLRITL